MQVEIRHLQLVLAICEEGTITRAGLRLHLSQSALSHQLQILETSLGYQLFVRLRGRLVATPMGERLAHSARIVLGELARAEREMRELHGQTSSTLRISTECSTSYHWLPPVIKQFAQQHPRVELQLVPATSKPIVEELLAGCLDLAIIQNRLNRAELATEPLFDDELAVIVGPHHPFRSRSYVDAQDFSTETIYMHSFPKENSRLFRDVLLPAAVQPRRVCQIELTEVIVNLVEAGLGVAVLACWAVSPHLQAGALSAVRITKDGLKRQWTAIAPNSSPYRDYLWEFGRLIRRNAPVPALHTPNPAAITTK